jgi:hypothetical protein
VTTGFVTDVTLAAVVDAFVADDALKHLGWGGGSGQGVGATDLASAFAESRTSGTLAAATTNTTDDTLRVTGTIVATDARTVTEVGVFTAPTGSVMQIYGDFPAVALSSGDSIAFTIDVVVNQG